jgi:hypothetical protein
MTRQPSHPRPEDRLLSALRSQSQPSHAFQGPSSEALERWSAVPLVFAGAPPDHTVLGRVVFDGWKDGGVALRDTASGHTRCLALQAGSVTLELVACRDERGWMFTARARDTQRVRHGLVLRFGRRRLLADANGFFQWRSRGVPRALELWSQDARLCFEAIPWQ